MRSKAWVVVFVGVTAAAQERPQKLCDFDGFGADPKLAAVTKATVGYFGCSTVKDCQPTKLAVGDVVTPYHAEGDWTCAYIQQRTGRQSGHPMD